MAKGRRKVEGKSRNRTALKKDAVSGKCAPPIASTPIIKRVSSSIKEVTSRIENAKKIIKRSIEERGSLIRDMASNINPHLKITGVSFYNYLQTHLATTSALKELTDKEYIEEWYENTKAQAYGSLIVVGYSPKEIEERVLNPKGTISRLWTKYHEFKKQKEDTTAVKRAVHLFEALGNIQELIENPIQEDVRFFMDLAAKESRFDQSQVSETGAVGAYQLTGDARDGANQRYNANVMKDDVYYVGPDKEKKILVGKNNAKIAILYWNYCKQHYAKNMPTENDKNLATAFMYNAGYGLFSRLWRHFKSKDYADFELKLNEKLIKTIPAIVKNKTGRTVKGSYNVSYRSHIAEDGRKTMPKHIKIGRREYEVQKLLDALEYVRIVEQFRQEKYLK